MTNLILQSFISLIASILPIFGLPFGELAKDHKPDTGTAEQVQAAPAKLSEEADEPLVEGGAPVPAANDSAEVPAQPPAEDGAEVSDEQLSELQEALIDATNRFRVQNELPELEPMPELNDLAQDWSEQLARTGGGISHRPNFAESYPEGGKHALENVLQNMTDAGADDLVEQWAKSPGHRKNMLDPEINRIGVGVTDHPDGKRYATQNFARY
ncbi:hypothetical protein KBX10_01460 [Corynebacterium sp. CCUG 59401]|nr:hypothetical protein [Corynebacterium pseudogenitalium]